MDYWITLVFFATQAPTYRAHLHKHTVNHSHTKYMQKMLKFNVGFFFLVVPVKENRFLIKCSKFVFGVGANIFLSDFILTILYKYMQITFSVHISHNFFECNFIEVPQILSIIHPHSMYVCVY